VSDPNSYFLPIEEAVARMVNLGSIPKGYALLDITEAFRDVAETELEDARLDKAPGDAVERLRVRFDVCNARDCLAATLLEQLKQESANPDSELDFDHESYAQPCVSLPSLAAWASLNYGVELSLAMPAKKRQPAWEDVTIKIYADYQLRWRVLNGKFHRSSFRDIGLMGMRQHQPNEVGAILIGLSKPGGRYLRPSSDKKYDTKMSHLRSALRRLTNIQAQPFYPPNDADGWRPRFRLIDDRRNADERAKTQAQHVPFDDTHDYQAEDDDAGKWLEQNE
jgi:hypothetical protein